MRHSSNPSSLVALRSCSSTLAEKRPGEPPFCQQKRCLKNKNSEKKPLVLNWRHCRGSTIASHFGRHFWWVPYGAVEGDVIRFVKTPPAAILVCLSGVLSRHGVWYPPCMEIEGSLRPDILFFLRPRGIPAACRKLCIAYTGIVLR